MQSIIFLLLFEHHLNLLKQTAEVSNPQCDRMISEDDLH